MDVVLGIDIGTGGTKALIVDLARGGAVLGIGASSYPLQTPQPRWIEQAPEDWWQATVLAIRQALAQSGLRGSDILGVGLTGQMQGSVLLDSSDQVLRPALLWCDQRTDVIVEQITQTIGEARLVELTSNPVLTGSTATKVIWLRENEPDLYARMRWLLLPKDYIRLRLTGEHATDYSDASATALFNVSQRTWSDEMLAALAVPKEWLPSVHDSSVLTGRIRAEAAELTGLAAGTPVMAGSGDDAAAAVGCGAVELGIVASSIGTSAVLLATSDRAAIDPLLRVDTWCHAAPGKWQNVGSTRAAGASLRWLKNTLGEAESSVAEHTGADAYDILCQEAARVPPGSEGLVFLPHLLGMRTPFQDARASGAFLGITLRHTKAHFVRAVLEGVAFGILDGLEVYKEMRVPLVQIRSLGGGARSPVWRQIQADILGLEHVTVNVTECAAFGAALMAGVGAGRFANLAEACRANVRVEASCSPQPQHASAYAENYRLYRAMTLAAHEFNHTGGQA
jgi:xylulokinase